MAFSTLLASCQFQVLSSLQPHAPFNLFINKEFVFFCLKHKWECGVFWQNIYNTKDQEPPGANECNFHAHFHSNVILDSFSSLNNTKIQFNSTLFIQHNYNFKALYCQVRHYNDTEQTHCWFAIVGVYKHKEVNQVSEEALQMHCSHQ